MPSIPPPTEEEGAGAVLSIAELGVSFVTPQGEVPAASEGIRPWIWVGGLIIIAIILLLYFGL